MSSLTSEQIKKIEENKRAALLRKQQTKHLSKFESAPQSIPKSNPLTKHNESTSNNNTFTKRPICAINANCVLITDSRFVVDMKYHALSVEIFKSIDGRLYDALSRKWTFPVTSYDQLMKKFQGLQTEVNITGIPKTVLDCFKNNSKVNLYSIDLSKIDPQLMSALMPFQEDGIRFAISKNGRCLIADDMGLGKTIQALGVAHYFNENWPLLIVCPSSMRFPWEESIQNFLPSVNPFHIVVVTSNKDVICDASVVICSYDIMKTSLDALKKINFGVIILDESHFLKSPKSVRTKCALELTRRAKNVILLSGTPALSRPQELYTQISAIDPHMFKLFHEFGVRYCAAKKDKFGWNYNGASNLEELELFLRKAIMIRRLKSEVLQQLPSKLRKMIILHPTMVKGVSKKLNEFESKLVMQKGFEKRETLLSYYCASGVAKLKAVCEYIEDKLESQDKFLVFGHHTEVLNGIIGALCRKNVDCIRIDGSTNPETRKQLCDRFQTDITCRVAVLSIKAANTGLTLTAANLVIFAELYWNPGELTQAEDRAHRIGQYSNVVIEYLVAKGTADEHLWRLIQSKLDILNKAGLSKDNFKDSNTEHVQDTKQKMLDSKFSEPVPKELNGTEHMFQTFTDVPVSQVEELKVRELEQSFFQDVEDDDVFENLNLEEIETEYEVENKKRKID